MSDADVDRLLERAWAGDGPREGFREQVLRDSLAAFARGRRRRIRRRMAALAAAAVLIAGVSFFVGRCSVPPARTGTTPVAREDRSVAVPSELVAWLQAARFFKQLGMEDRVALAYGRASDLLPQDVAAASGVSGSVFARDGGMVENPRKNGGPADPPGLGSSIESVSRIMAQAFGD